MSTHAAVPHEGNSHRILRNLFALTTILFIAGGAFIVLAQLVLIVAAQGGAARELADAVGPYVFGMSSGAGLLAFMLSYFSKGANLDGE